MTAVGGVVTFIIIWWLVLFMVLPWQIERIENPEPGHADGAPANPQILKKMLVTTAIAVVVFAIVWVVIETGWITFRL